MSAHATVVLLIRHAHTDVVGKRLAGREAGIPLSVSGLTQADRLGRALACGELHAIYTSPLDRAVDTARALARYRSVPVHERADLNEIEFGEWTGKAFGELEALPAWREFNRTRSTAIVPGGETAPAVQRRILTAIDTLVHAHPGQTIAIISHLDVLRYALAQYAGASLDMYGRFEISPGSVTAVAFSDEGPRLLYVNRSVAASGWSG